MKKIKFSSFVLVAFLLFSSAAMVNGQSKGFRVQGTKILESNGNQFIMRGVNFPYNWYKDQLNTAIPAIAATGANIVRVVLSNGGRWTKNTSQDIQSIISLCKQNKLIAILEVHDCTGYPEQSGSAQLSTAVDYWIEMKNALVDQEDYVIINIANEPFGNNVAAATWLNEHKTAISRLRTNGFEHALMVDAANWGQDWEFIMRNSRSTELFNSDPLKKVIFSIHMYDVFNTGTKVNDYLNYFANTLKLPLVVGEFAADHGSSKPVAAQDILTRCQQYGIGYLGWSWKGNSSGLESLDISVDWNGTSLTTWGNLLVNGTNGIKATSKIATIFGGATNQPPTVSLTAPVNNATFTAPASIIISANATDPDGSIAYVEFYNGTTKLGQSTTAPYSYTWSNVTAGTYLITARATDNQNATTTSDARSVTVNQPANQPPTVSLTAPVNNATFTAPASIIISANATDPDGSIAYVEFYNGTTKLGQSTTAPYSYTWSNAAAGTYLITARATDNQNATTTSDARSVTVNPPANQPPTVSLTAPVNNATFTAPASIIISANATDPDGSITRVEFYNGTTKLGQSTTTPYSYTWSNVTEGTYSITAKATDNQGATTTSDARSVTVNPPANQPPTVSLTAPVNNATFTAPASIIISANATDPDGSITRVEFYNGTTKLGQSTTTPYSYTWSNVTEGTYSITAKATDNQGATTTSDARSVTVNPPANQPPTVSLTSPNNNATFTSPASITISATATDPDGSITLVEFFNGPTKLGESSTTPFSYTWNNVTAGTYSITARATDNKGATATSDARSVTVNSPANQPPTVSLTSPNNNATFTAPASITISATATDPDGSITLVEFFNGTTKLGESTTAPYNYTWSNVITGTYSITARATDNKGATATSAACSVTVNPPANQLPTVSLTSPNKSAIFTAPASITIIANATDADGSITRVEFFNDTTKLGECTTTPYRYTWRKVAAGRYSITARATDNKGATATSSACSVTVDLSVSAISRLGARTSRVTLTNNILELEVARQNRLHVSLVSLKGELVYRGFFTESTKLSLHSFVPSGTYVLSVKNAEKLILKQKVNLIEW
jgi:hypothetical protein